jgi:Arc/MetJ-type ribon-helix-helix transcriptional regulator
MLYGSVYGMRKTTVYLPDDLKRDLERVAAARGLSEAELIREAVRTLARESAAPRPRLPLFESGKPRLAERIDQALAGFGER